MKPASLSLLMPLHQVSFHMIGRTLSIIWRAARIRDDFVRSPKVLWNNISQEIGKKTYIICQTALSFLASLQTHRWPVPHTPDMHIKDYNFDEKQLTRCVSISYKKPEKFVKFAHVGIHGSRLADTLKYDSAAAPQPSNFNIQTRDWWLILVTSRFNKILW